MSKSSQKGKQKINIITKDLSRRQIIMPIESNNVEKIMAQSNIHIANINRQFKNIKSEISVKFICSNNKGIVVTY